MPFDVERMLGLEGLFDGEIKHATFDCPINLREVFKKECKANGTSVCKELQKFRLSYIVASRIRKNALGNTLAKLVDVPFTIENLNFEQYVQSRPRRLLRKNDESDPAKLNLCTIANCKKTAVGKGMYLRRNETYQLCENHLCKFGSMPSEWKVVRLNDSMESLKSEGGS
jgi:hypothetical protein